MKTRMWGVAVILWAGIFAATQPAQAATAAEETYLFDTLTLESARAADSLRRAAAPTDTAPSVPQAGVDSAAPALSGTPEGRGSISGKVISETRGTALQDVRVIVAGQNLSANTDADGRFGFPGLPPGKYSLFMVHSSYAPLTVDSLMVVAGRDATRRFAMPDKAIQGEAVRITGSATQASDAGMLFARKNSPAVSDGISSEQISKSPDSDAAAALKRVTGISIAGDGLVYVRGLGERYVNMQLNGLNVSSPNPEKRVVPLDMFPTRLLENLNVSKTFTADQPAEFAGGSLQLRTKDYPDKRLIEVSAGVGYEPGSTFGSFRTYEGGSLDFLGIDDGKRALPGIVPEGRFDDRSENLGSTPEEIKAQQQKILASLPNVWTPYTTRAPINQSYGFTMGNKIPLGDERVFGWLVGGNYSAKWSLNEDFSSRIALNGAEPTYADRVVNEVSTESIQWGTLATATYQHNADHKIRTNFLMNRDWEDEVSRTYGRREVDSDTSLLYELTNAQQTLMNTQFEGDHKLTSEGMRLTWIAALTQASRVEPDRRVSKYILNRTLDSTFNPDFPYTVGATGGLQDRYWFDLQERGVAAKSDIEIPVEFAGAQEGSKAKGGIFVFSKRREYDVRRLTYVAGPGVSNSDLRYGHTYEDYFGAFNGAADSGYLSNRDESAKDDYTVNDFQWAAHVQGDWILSDAWRFIAGARLISATVEGKARASFGELSPVERDAAVCNGDACIVPFGYDEMAVLPAASLVYAVTENQNVRTSWTRTFSYPEYREMAPLLFYSHQEALETVGNIDLKPTDIYNYDIRWEWFPSGSEILALSGFYKDFKDPVESRIRQLGSNNRADFVNAPSAMLYGIETEARVDLDRVHSVLSDFQALVNYTWIQSEVEGTRKRPMQGQSPYLINAILFFEPFEGATQMSLLYNKFGRRITKVGVDNFPDVLEEPRESLEFSYTQKWGKQIKSKFTARNITDAPVVQTQGGLVVKRQEPGTQYSLGVTYAF